MQSNNTAASPRLILALSGARHSVGTETPFAPARDPSTNKPSSRVDDYCSRVDDELRQTEKRCPLLGLAVITTAGLSALAVVAAVLTALMGR